MNGYPPDAREYFVSNFEFALLESIELAGYKSASEIERFSKRCTDEIYALRESGKVELGYNFLPMMPSPRIKEYGNIAKGTYQSIKYLILQEGQKRQTVQNQNNDVASVTEWNSFLHTWTIGNEKFQKYGNMVIDRFYLPILYWITMPLIFLGMIFSLLIGIQKLKSNRLYATIGIVLYLSLFAFSAVIGTVNEMAFPILQYPQSYNSMGFFIINLLIVVSAAITFEGISVWLSNKRNT